jgi:hypothetical protein
LVNSMPGELELPLCDFLTDFFNHCSIVKLYLQFASIHNLYVALLIQAPNDRRCAPQRQPQ